MQERGASAPLRRREPPEPRRRPRGRAHSASAAGCRSLRAGALRRRSKPVSAPPGSHPSIPRLADELRQAGSRSLVAAGREQPAARSRPRARDQCAARRVRHDGPRHRAGAAARRRGRDARGSGGGDRGRAGVPSRRPRRQPGLHAPADIDLAALIRRVPLSLHLGPASRRDGGRLPLARSGEPSPRKLGRSARLRRHRRVCGSRRRCR